MQTNDSRHDQRSQPGTENYACQRRAKQVAGGPSQHREVDHLGGKDEGGQDACQRYEALAVICLRPAHGQSQNEQRYEPGK